MSISIARKPIDWKVYEQFDGTDAEFARRLGMSPNHFAQIKRWTRKREEARHGTGPEPPASVALALPSAEDTALHSAETVQSSAGTLADRETRLQVLESFVKALQEQAQYPPVQAITVQSSAGYALPSAVSGQSWDDPEDAKPERWNLWVPRGLKRRIEAHAKAAGMAPSQLVQRLLARALEVAADG